MVASRVGGIPMQMTAGGGVLVDTIPEAAEGCAKILKDEDFARSIGRRGKEHVREHFLMPRQLRDNLALYAKLMGA